ncbi:hypothetical protein SESBI_46501 [Sesbania bispinosa]|nr:hypothetical protein SESBI_46501 [Sesbania bispinosa]
MAATAPAQRCFVMDQLNDENTAPPITETLPTSTLEVSQPTLLLDPKKNTKPTPDWNRPRKKGSRK